MTKYGWLEPIFYLLGLNLVVASWLLVREVLLRPRRIWSLSIALSCFVSVLTLLQIATGYYFAFNSGKTSAYIAAGMAYVALMVLAVFGKRTAGSPNRIVGLFGLGMPVLIAAIAPELLLFGPMAIFGFDNNHPRFQARISPTLSYRVAIEETLLGGRKYYRYALFRNPQGLPIVRKIIAGGWIDKCEIPAAEVSLKADAESGSVHVVCRERSDTVLDGEIRFDPDFGNVTVTAPK
jgi:hypothetical protein